MIHTIYNDISFVLKPIKGRSYLHCKRWFHLFISALFSQSWTGPGMKDQWRRTVFLNLLELSAHFWILKLLEVHLSPFTEKSMKTSSTYVNNMWQLSSLSNAPTKVTSVSIEIFYIKNNDRSKNIHFFIFLQLALWPTTLRFTVQQWAPAHDWETMM